MWPDNSQCKFISEIDIIYKLFFKAFDRVGHYKLISTLDTLDIGDPLFSWPYPYLINKMK